MDEDAEKINPPSEVRIRNGFSGPDADNELGDGQVVLRLRRFENCDANNSKKRSVGSPAADNRAVSRL